MVRTALIAVAVLGVFAAAIAGSYQLFKAHVTDSLRQRAVAEFQEGNYLASLQHYAQLKQNIGGADEQQDAEKNIEKSKDLLLASEILKRARRAAENGEWFEVKALLQEGDVTTNTSFTRYEEAIELYVTAANKVKELEKKIDAELAQLRQEARTEEGRREEAEARASQIATELESARTQQEQTQQVLRQTAAEAAEAKQAAKQERLEKFLNELGLYVDMLARGAGNLDEAIGELDKKRGLAARAFLDQAAPLFEEVDMRASELLENRTPEAYAGEVQKLLGASSLLTEAMRSLGSAVLYAGDEDETEQLKRFVADGRKNRNDARSLLDAIRSFIQSARVQ